MSYAEYYQDIKNEFIVWVDAGRQFSLHHIINRDGNEMYAIYDEKKGVEYGSCYADGKNGLIMWAKGMIPHWKAIDVGGNYSVRE